MAVDKSIPSFDEIIQADRKRRKNEDLANQIMGKSRRASAPGPGGSKNRKQPSTPSLADRIGISKRPASTGPKSAPRTPSLAQRNTTRAALTPIPATRPSHPRSFAPRQTVVERYAQAAVAQPEPVPAGLPPVTSRGGMSIKGAAPTFTVIASNFAPGTTAADIQSVMEPIGGEGNMVSCKLVATNPTVMAEMVFLDQGGAENVIATFNNQRADGRLLYVYLKGQVATPSASVAHSRPIPTGPRNGNTEAIEVDDDSSTGATLAQSSRAAPVYQDGRYGFEDPSGRDSRRDYPSQRPPQGLRSDNMFSGNRGGRYRR